MQTWTMKQDIHSRLQYINMLFSIDGKKLLVRISQGSRQEFSDGGVDSSDEGAKIWFLRYCKCQKSPKKSCFTFRRGLAFSDGGL